MIDTAKLFLNGRSQIVRLPKEHRFNGSEVNIKKVGNAVLLIPYNAPWQTLFDSLNKFSNDFMKIGVFDLLIAAHAMRLGITLVTYNVREFSRIPGLCVENWV